MKACEGLKGYAESHAMLLKVGPKLAAQIAAAFPQIGCVPKQAMASKITLTKWTLTRTVGSSSGLFTSTLKSRFPTRESTLLLCGATFLQDEPDQAAASSLLYSASQQGPRVVS